MNAVYAIALTVTGIVMIMNDYDSDNGNMFWQGNQFSYKTATGIIKFRITPPTLMIKFYM